MRIIITAAFISAATALIAAPDQTTARPGQMTDARVWVENRGRAQAIPVDLRDANIDTPLRVNVVNGTPGAMPPMADPLPVRIARQIWEYKTIEIRATDDAAKLLAADGIAGWEATGVAFPGENKTTLLLKRLR